MFLDVSGWLWGVRGRQSPEKFRFFGGGDGHGRVHHHTTTRTNPFVDNPPPTTQVERLRAPYCGVEPELAGSLLGQGSDR